MITAAQRAAVVAADLPFELSDADIERQWNTDGSPKPFVSKFPMLRARKLAHAAMDAFAGQTPMAHAA